MQAEPFFVLAAAISHFFGIWKEKSGPVPSPAATLVPTKTTRVSCEPSPVEVRFDFQWLDWSAVFFLLLAATILLAVFVVRLRLALGPANQATALSKSVAGPSLVALRPANYTNASTETGRHTYADACTETVRLTLVNACTETQRRTYTNAGTETIRRTFANACTETDAPPRVAVVDASTATDEPPRVAVTDNTIGSLVTEPTATEAGPAPGSKEHQYLMSRKDWYGAEARLNEVALGAIAQLLCTDPAARLAEIPTPEIKALARETHLDGVSRSDKHRVRKWHQEHADTLVELVRVAEELMGREMRGRSPPKKEGE